MKDHSNSGMFSLRFVRLFQKQGKVAEDTLFAFIAAFFLELWVWKATGKTDFLQFLTYILLGYSLLSSGRLFCRTFRIRDELFHRPAFEFLAGVFLTSTITFAIKLISPLTILESLAACSFIAVLAVRIPAGNRITGTGKDFHPFDFLALLISGTGASLWCWDAMSPPVTQGSMTVFPVWIDCFEHMRTMSALSQASGWGCVANIAMAGASLHPYHYGSLVIPSALETLFGATSYDMYVAFWLPFGFFLTGLAASLLGTVLFGWWPGIAAIVAVLFLPDAYLQGSGCKYFCYFFLQSIAPAGLYGTAAASLASIFMIQACRTEDSRFLWPGLAFLIGIAFFKAQIFFATLIPFITYTCLFFTKGGIVKRILILGIVASACMTGFLALETSHSLPTLGFDLDSLAAYSRGIAGATSSPLISQLISEAGSSSDTFHWLLFLICNCFLTFGLWILLFAAVCIVWGRSTPVFLTAFPVFVITGYLITSEGLAMNSNGIYLADELKHRPFVWAYFSTVVWTSSLVCQRVQELSPIRRQLIAILAIMVFFASLLLPYHYRKGLQTMPNWGVTENKVPTPLVEIANYIRKVSPISDTVQCSPRKDKYVLSALSERQGFAITTIDELPQDLKNRFSKLVALRTSTNAEEIVSFFHDHSINWFVRYPSDRNPWPESVEETHMTEINGFRLYHFPNVRLEPQPSLLPWFTKSR